MRRTDRESAVAALPVERCQRASLLIIDEAARVPDDLYRTVRPMLAASDGKLLCLSTPNGKHGFFHDAWAHGGADWHRIEITARQCPRIRAEFLEEERRNLGDTWFRQEYECSFEAMEGLVYPDFARLVQCEDREAKIEDRQETSPAAPARRTVILSPRLAVSLAPLSSRSSILDPRSSQQVGGIDFGFRNPFAAVWGHVDRDGILWLTGEHYAAQQPLSFHARRLPRDVTWYADPAGASDIAELRCAGFCVRKGNNALRTGIMAVTARLHHGTLKVLPGACPNLLREAGLYRWAASGESPEDDHNHALAALRYLLTRLDAKKLALTEREEAAPARPERQWLSVHNEELWTRIV